jgi:putative exporter of polyketide antibiotics
MPSSLTTGCALGRVLATSAQVSSARHRRHERKVRHEAVAGHVGADQRRVGAAALGELAVAIALAGLGAFGLGVAQQHQTAHGDNVAFPALSV